MDEAKELTDSALRETQGFFAELGDKILKFLPTLMIAIIVFILGTLLAKLVTNLFRRAMKRASVEGTAQSFGRSFFRILLYIILIIICLSILGVPMNSIVTVLGAAGITIGLAVQNCLSNVAGGFIILFSKIFIAGDYVIIGTDEGYVEAVTILHTRLRDRSNRTIYVPNGNVTSGTIVNLSKRGTVRLTIPMLISYDADIDKARKALLKAVSEDKQYLKDPAPTITVEEHADSGVRIAMYVWVHSDDYFAAKCALLELAKHTLDAAKIEIPYPQIVVHADDAKKS